MFKLELKFKSKLVYLKKEYPNSDTVLFMKK